MTSRASHVFKDRPFLVPVNFKGYASERFFFSLGYMITVWKTVYQSRVEAFGQAPNKRFTPTSRLLERRLVASPLHFRYSKYSEFT